MKLNPAARVAAGATAVIAVLYVIGVIVFNVVFAIHQTAQSDYYLGTRLAAAAHDPAILSQDAATAGSSASDDVDADSAPVFLWLVNPAGTVTAHSPGAPGLPDGLFAAHPPHDGLALTAGLGKTGAFRLKLIRDGGSWLIAGQSRAGDAHTERLLLYAEVIAGPFLLLAMFFGSLVVGLRALAPVEQSRRRQLEFTADASHELRTPLSVIRAEADVALSSPREAAEYRDALTRIQGESRRLRQLVDDMLWLARFDSRPPPPGDEPVDLVTLAQACADRFRAVGPAVTAEVGAGPALISAPPEWIDRLAGVLMDNACRYAGPDGQVRIGVRAQGNRVSLTVEDSGPGIPAQDRPRLFDRFHRATEHGPGAGLGLAIGDSIVRSTGGRWQVGDSPLGGALMTVSWKHTQPHRPSTPRFTTSGASASPP
ncbi:MAG TPA: HAMP domain-containing sensor histidine kinase [Streptosporangiaceae bacterium]|nr:HAMP domain-containing sensor histidine kinase [Streptosporangiaceae bacterium]